jgi:hypothetical protein
VDEFVIEYTDGSRQVQEGSWAVARDLALKAKLDRFEPLGRWTTRWYRR